MYDDHLEHTVDHLGGQPGGFDHRQIDPVNTDHRWEIGRHSDVVLTRFELGPTATR